MAVKLRKPILVGGIGISLVLWLWESFQESFIEVGELSVVGVIALGMVFWLFQEKTDKSKLSLPLWLPLKRENVEGAIAQAETMIPLLETEALDRDISELKQQVSQLPELLHRSDLKIAITGGKKTGKTSLKQVVENQNIADNICFVETEALFTEIDNQETIAKEVALASDLVLFLTNGDLTDSQWQILQELRNSHQRLLLLFNKQDQYLPEERAIILQQLQQRVKKLILEEDVLAISATPQSLKVRQHQQDGSVQEWIEKSIVEIDVLREQLTKIISQEREQLIWATTWREAVNLKKKARTILNQVRRDRAVPVIEQYQWIAAATAFANPVAALDLLATAAINTQLLVDLSEIYQQKFSFSQAQTASGTIGKLMVKLGLVELSTQTIASLLKSNAISYIAGGIAQGVSAAYLTRLAGLSLIEYFQEQEIIATSGEKLNLERLSIKLQQVFQQNQRNVFLPSFVKQAVAYLSPESSPSEISSPESLVN